MTVKTVEQISDQIVAAFPKKVKNYYFMREGSKASKGKLYAKYNNVVRILKNGGLIESAKRPKPSNVEMSNVHHINNFDSETNLDLYLNSLKHDNCTFNEIKVIWKATIKYRLNYIKNSLSTTETLKHWSSYKLPAGYKLIDIDFNMLYPSASSLLTIYPDVSSKQN